MWSYKLAIRRLEKNFIFGVEEITLKTWLHVKWYREGIYKEKNTPGQTEKYSLFWLDGPYYRLCESGHIKNKQSNGDKLVVPIRVFLFLRYFKQLWFCMRQISVISDYIFRTIHWMNKLLFIPIMLRPTSCGVEWNIQYFFENVLNLF